MRWKTITKKDTIETIKTQYVDGAFVESHGREVMDIIRPTDSQVIARVTLADEEDTRHAIAQLNAHSPHSDGRLKKSVENLAQVARGHLGAHRRSDGRDGRGVRWRRPVRQTHRAVGHQRVPESEKALQQLPLVRTGGGQQ